MCGIAGIITFDRHYQHAITETKAMANKLYHRGPDDGDLWVNARNSVYFSHRRLSIIDLSKSARQPMVTDDGRLVITYNGEIYNYLQIREECIKLGSQFHTASDTEVILEAYRHWGVGSFSLLRGMWAFALYDAKLDVVIFSRDRFAIKPLYYGIYEGRLYFSSEINALTQINEHFAEHDIATMQLFLKHASLERGNWTFYKNIKRFPHAHYSIINLDKTVDPLLTSQRYWQPPKPNTHNMSFEQARDELAELLRESVHLHMQADVPVGSCLSGGIDSSAIVTLGSRYMQDKKFTTFTTHYPHYLHYDETSWAKLVTTKNNCESYFIQPCKHRFAQDLNHLIAVQNEPFGSMSIYAQYCIFRKISQTKIKVVLDGQGADEMFAGYLGFLPLYFENLLQTRQLLTLARESYAFRRVKIPGFSFSANIKKACKMFIRGYRPVVNCNQSDTDLLNEFESRLAMLHEENYNFEYRLSNLLTESNIPQLLRYEDRNSMAFSIESRVPFLDVKLVDFALSLPATYKIRGGFTKAILRQSLQGLVPNEILNRRDKMGFPAPEVEWLSDLYSIQANSTSSIEWRQFILSRWLALQSEPISDLSHKTLEQETL